MGSKLVLTSEEEIDVSIPVDIWEASSISYDQCLIGKVISQKQVHLDSLEKTLLGIWNLAKGANFQKFGSDRFLIHFGNGLEKKQI